MRVLAPLPLLLLLIACGGSPTSPTPPPPQQTFTGTVTNTVTGGAVSGFTATIANGRLTVSAPGYVTRETGVGATTVDLIPEAGFDLGFYRQLLRDTFDTPAGMQPLRILDRAPSIYLQRNDLSDATVTALEVAARALVPAFTGGRFAVAAWETGEAPRVPQDGWITFSVVNDSGQPCGSTFVGLTSGRGTLNTAARCNYEGHAIDPPLFAHELGHALGFEHVAAQGHLMHQRATFAERRSIEPSAAERHHGAIAYKRPRGNRDVDSD